MIFINIFFTKQRWLIGCLFTFMYACNNKSPTQLKLVASDSIIIKSINDRADSSIKNAKQFIKQGDMILRTGNDFTSESLRQLSLIDKTYSHCGIASIENDSIVVYHCLGGEWNPDEKLRRDPIELFCNVRENRGFGMYSFNMDDKEIMKLDSIVKSWYKKGITFDMKFDLKSDDKLYCSEFVSKAISIATDKQILFSATHINNFDFVAIDNLFLNRHCKEKMRITFK